jgi:cyclohexyl-isocyanide hydratase
MKQNQTPLEIGMLLYPGLTLLDLIGPQTVFSWFANTHLVRKTKDVVRSDTGIGIEPVALYPFRSPAAPSSIELKCRH